MENKKSKLILSMFTLLVINFGIANIVEAGLIFKAPSSIGLISGLAPLERNKGFHLSSIIPVFIKALCMLNYCVCLFRMGLTAKIWGGITENPACAGLSGILIQQGFWLIILFHYIPFLNQCQYRLWISRERWRCGDLHPEDSGWWASSRAVPPPSQSYRNK